jgi:hypothetical protein
MSGMEKTGTSFDWRGYHRENTGAKAGLVKCLTCGRRFPVPRCQLADPSVQTCIVLSDHRREHEAPVPTLRQS